MRNARKLFYSVMLATSLVGCGTPFEYHSQNEIPKGPGMFTGEAGALVFSTDGKKEEKSPQTNVSAGTSSSTADEYREFLDFQEFRRWKEGAKDTPLYREFQDWREWRSYRMGKGQQRK